MGIQQFENSLNSYVDLDHKLWLRSTGRIKAENI
jgi:hypothetical protein